MNLSFFCLMSNIGRCFVKSIRKAEITYPTGDPKFSVLQAFPAAFSAEESDPLLMLDHFGPTISPGSETDPDSFPIDWHPHRGQALLTYMVQGVGRHADSLGNRETFSSPGAQWCFAGSGIMHAEGGGTPKGELQEGFQIWINVPSALKMKEPSYGTHPSSELPVIHGSHLAPGVSARLVAGSFLGTEGPFKAPVSLCMVDYTLASGSTFLHPLTPSHDNCLIYVYQGSGFVGGKEISRGMAAQLGNVGGDKTVELVGGSGGGFKCLLFSGKKLSQPIAWHGPFVMTSKEENSSTLRDYRNGTLLQNRVPWDFTKIGEFPKK